MNFLTQSKPRKQSLILSEKDYYRLHLAIDHEKRKGRMSRKRLRRIRNVLRHVNFYPIRLFPQDVVTMNSVLELTGKDGAIWVVRLAYPHEAAKEQRCVSVFSGLGMKLLGRHTGEAVRTDRMWVGKILFQPESLNLFHL